MLGGVLLSVVVGGRLGGVARGLGLKVQGRHHLPRRGAFLLAVNHVSFLDPVVVAVACPRRLIFLARAELFEIPWLGPFMRLMQALPIARRGSGSGLREAIHLLRRGHAMTMFPEGGRQLSGSIGTAKPGVGLVAANARVPIVPVLLQGTSEALPPGAKWLHRAKIRVAFGSPIRYTNYSLSSSIYNQIAQQVTESWHRLWISVTSLDRRHGSCYGSPFFTHSSSIDS